MFSDFLGRNIQMVTFEVKFSKISFSKCVVSRLCENYFP